MSELILYETEDRQSRIQLRAEGETMWLSQLEIAELFLATKQNISLHLKNIFGDGVLDPGSIAKESMTPARPMIHKIFTVFACGASIAVAHYSQQTSRASACMRNTGGIFLSGFTEEKGSLP